MGVVRREGGWRLEKRSKGEYEITYEKRPQERILTPAYSSDPMTGFDASAIPTHRVDSYEEAEGLFEERTRGSPKGGLGLAAPSGMGASNSNDPIQRDAEGIDDVDLDEIPPGIFATGLLLSGAIMLWTVGLDTSSPMFLIGVGCVILGFGIPGVAIILADDFTEAFSNLVSTSSNSSTEIDQQNTPEKTPPTPEKLKNDLYFDRAGQKCEWCGEQIDHPEVHHIVPRSEGGPNERTNLIGLCPNHHRMADSGGISQSKLKAKVRRIEGEN